MKAPRLPRSSPCSHSPKVLSTTFRCTVTPLRSGVACPGPRSISPLTSGLASCWAVLLVDSIRITDTVCPVMFSFDSSLGTAPSGNKTAASPPTGEGSPRVLHCLCLPRRRRHAHVRQHGTPSSRTGTPAMGRALSKARLHR